MNVSQSSHFRYGLWHVRDKQIKYKNKLQIKFSPIITTRENSKIQQVLQGATPTNKNISIQNSIRV